MTQDTLVVTLLSLSIPLLTGLAFSGVLALLALWKKANAAAKQSSAVLASMQLEAGVEAAVNGLKGELGSLSTQLYSGALGLPQFASQVLVALKKEGQQYIIPSVAEALGTSLGGLEDMALAIAAKKVGLVPPPKLVQK